MNNAFFGPARLALTGVFTFTFAASLTLAAQEVTPVDPSQNPAADYVLDGPTVFTAAPNTTNVYSGVISGVGPAIIDGGGWVAFSNPNNSYTGGTLVSNATFRLDAEGCAGVNAITGAVNTAHVYFNCARVPYTLRFLGLFNQQITSTANGDNPVDGGRPIYSLVSDVTVTGKVSFANNTWLVTGYNKGPSRTITFEDDLAVDSGKWLQIAPYGKTVINGKLIQGQGGSLFIGNPASAYGVVELQSTSNTWPSVLLHNGNINLKAEDALPNSIFYFRYGDRDNNNKARIDLFGNDQTIAGMGCYNNLGDWAEDSKGRSFASTGDKMATLRIKGCKKSGTPSLGYLYLTNVVALLDNLSLVMDVDPTFTTAGFCQIFSTRLNTMTGNLLISNGVFGVTTTATFPNVPEIYVGTGGVFKCSATKSNAFLGCTNLTVEGEMTFDDDVSDPFGYRTMAVTLGKEAKLTLPTSSGYTLTVPSLKVERDGELVDLPDETYGDGGISIDQLKRGTIIVHGFHEGTAATWTGGGADTSVSTAENWDPAKMPNFDNSTLLATFASGGSTASLDSDVALRGIVLDKPDTGFSFTGAGRTISLDAAGFTFGDTTPADGESPRSYTFEPQVSQLSSFDMNLNIPTNVTLSFLGGYQQSMTAANFKTGDGTLVLGGNGGITGSWKFDGGFVRFEGTNNVNGTIVVSNTTIRMAGKITQEGGTPATQQSTYQWNPGADGIFVDCFTDAGAHPPRSHLIIDNADIGKRIGVSGGSVNTSYEWFTVTAGSTNTLRGQLLIFRTGGILNFGKDSLTTVEGPVSIDGETRLCGDGEVVFAGGMPWVGGGGWKVQDSMRLKIGGTASFKNGGQLSCANTSRTDLLTDDIFTDTYSTANRNSFLLLGGTCTVNMHGTRQSPSCFCADAEGIISGSFTSTLTGEFGSELRPVRGFLPCAVNGGVSVTSCGTNGVDVVCFTNRAYASCGDLKAQSGIMHFAANASWLNGTNVTVCSGAKLELNASETFGEHAVLHAEGENWKIDLADGVRQKFAEFQLNGVPQAKGTYGAIGNTAAKYRLANITGGGLIRVGKLGMVLSVR